MSGARKCSRFRPDFAGDHPAQGGFSGTIAADEANMSALRQSGARLVEQEARPEPQGEVVDMEHAVLVAAATAFGKRRLGRKPCAHAGIRRANSVEGAE